MPVLLSEESDYCYSCGGKVIRNRLTMLNLMEHFTETFFNYDNQLLQTFIILFKTPEDVIIGYINGTRKKYVDVISYFAIAITLSGLKLFIINKFYPDAMNMSSWTTKGTEKLQSDVMSSAQEYQSIIMMLYVPIYAIISRIVFYDNKTYNYTEQLVIYMYIYAQISIAGAFFITLLVIVGIDFSILGLFMFPAMIGYSAYCLKRIYQLSILELILKTIIFFIVFGILAVAILMLFMVGMYVSGGFEKIIEAQKEA